MTESNVPPIAESDAVAIEELTEALRFTVEYVGTDALPAVEGWSWYDALCKYAPEKAAAFVKPDVPEPDDLLYEAWVLIANARGWDGERTQDHEWEAAAVRWRDKWHATLPTCPTCGVLGLSPRPTTPACTYYAGCAEPARPCGYCATHCLCGTRDTAPDLGKS